MERAVPDFATLCPLASLQNEALNLGLVQDLCDMGYTQLGEELLWQLGQQALARIVGGFVSSTFGMNRVETDLGHVTCLILC